MGVSVDTKRPIVKELYQRYGFTPYVDSSMVPLGSDD